MADVTSWEEADYAYVRDVLAGFTPAAAEIPAWRGLTQAGSPLPAGDPQPSGQAEQPAVYTVWDLVYDRTQGDFEADGAPIRFGRLRLADHVEIGGRRGALRALSRLRKAFLDAVPEGGELDFDIQAARPETSGFARGDWWIRVESIPFVGT